MSPETTTTPIQVVVEQPINWPTFVTAIAALISAVFAAVAVILQGRRTRRQLGIENMWRLIDRWDDLEETRETTALLILENWEQRDDLPVPAHDLLGTFEVLAYLVVRSKTLSLEDAWINFSGPAIQWWHVFKPGIEKMQKIDPTMYEDYVNLVKKLLKMEAKRRGKNQEQLRPTDADLKAFLAGEPSPSGDAVQDLDSPGV